MVRLSIMQETQHFQVGWKNQTVFQKHIKRRWVDNGSIWIMRMKKGWEQQNLERQRQHVMSEYIQKIQKKQL